MFGGYGIFFLFVFLKSPVICAQTILPDSLFEKARRSLINNNYAGALDLYEQYLEYVQKKKDWFKTGNAFIGIGIANDRTGDYQNALTNYFKALNAYERAGDYKKQAGTLKNIGNTYRVIKSYDKAYDFFQQAITKFKLLRDSTGLSNVLNDMGIMYMDNLLNKEALLYFNEVITNYEKYAEPKVMAYAKNNAAIVYSKLKDYVNAYNNYMASLKMMKSLNEEYGVALLLINLGDLFNKQSNYNDALRSSKEGLMIAEKIHSKQLIASAFKNLADSYNFLTDYKQSALYLYKLLILNDTLFKKESARGYAEMEARYQNEKKQKELVILKNENTIKGIDLANHQRTQYYLLIILSLVLLTTIMLYRAYSIKQKLNKQLNISNKKLDEANESKIKLLSIIAHDLRSPISNLFNFLYLQKRSSDKLSLSEQEKFSQQINRAAENLLEAVEDVLIWSKSQMEKFTPSSENVNLHELFEEIINLNTIAADNKNISLIKTCSADLIFQIDLNFLKIILRNLISNAIKFTPSGGKIELIAVKDAKTVVITISDNGSGISSIHLNSIFDWNSIRSDSTGLGLKLAKEFTEKLNGTINVFSQVSKGTEFILTFPVLHQ